MKNFLKQRQLRRQDEKQREEAKKRKQLVARLRVETADIIEILRKLKTEPPLRGQPNELRYNAQIYQINMAYLERRLLGTGIAYKDIGLSDEERFEIYRVAVRADIIEDAPKFGLTVTEGSSKLSLIS